MITLIKAIQTHIQGDSSLLYIESTVIRKYTENSLPDFENYAVIISPNTRRKHLIANRTQQKTISLDIVCIVREFDTLLSLIGENPGEVGIIKMIEDVEGSLFSFGESADGVMVLYDEMDDEVRFNHHQFTEREGFFHEVTLPYKIRLEPKEF